MYLTQAEQRVEEMGAGAPVCGIRIIYHFLISALVCVFAKCEQPQFGEYGMGEQNAIY